MNTNLRLFWPVILSVLCFSCDRMKYPTPSELFHDYKARAYVTLEMYEDAMSEYLKMIEENPMRFSTHNNFGILLNMVQKPEEAVKSLEHSLALAEHEQDPVKMFTASFNLGVLNGLLKNYEKALMHYQNALNIVPTSIETKTNIELLIQQQQQQQNQNGQGQSNSSDKDNKDGQSGENKTTKTKIRKTKTEKMKKTKIKKIIAKGKVLRSTNHAPLKASNFRKAMLRRF